MKTQELFEAKTKLEDIDAVREKLADMGSAADTWMGEPNLKKLLKHLNDGGKVKAINVDASRGEDKHKRNDVVDKRVDKLKSQGWEKFDWEWDGDGEHCDVVLIKKA